MTDSNITNEFKRQDITKVNLKEIFLRYRKYLPYVLIAVIIGAALGYLKIRYSTPIYETKASILIKNENKYRSDENSKFMDLFMSGGDQNIINEQEILKSRPLVSRVVNSLNLQISYYNKGRVRTSLLYKDVPFTLNIIKLTDTLQNFALHLNAISDAKFILDGDKTEYSYGQPFHLKNGLFTITRNNSINFNSFGSREFDIIYSSLSNTVESIVAGIKVQRSQDFSNILEITSQNENPALSRAIIDMLMIEYGNVNIEDKNRIAVNTLNFINDRLDSLGAELGGVESDLQKYREKNQAIDLEQQSGFYLENLKDVEDLIRKQAINLKIVDYLIDYIRSSENIYKIVPSNLGIEEVTLLPLFTAYNEKILEREAYLKNTPEKNIIIQNLNTQIDKLKQDILENLNNVRKSYAISQNDLERRNSSLSAQIQRVPGTAKGLLEITRQQKIKEELFLFLLKKKEETAISSASTIANSRVVEPPISTSFPVKPSSGPIYLSYILGALATVMAIIVLIELLNDKVKTRRDIERITESPILGEVSHTSIVKNALVVETNSRSIIAEQFRILRTSLQYVLKDSKSPVVLVSSTFSGEGKSFIATNLAAAVALTGKRTVILEFDIRKPKVLAGLDIRHLVGVTNYIVGNASIDDIIVRVDKVENLFVIPCGPIPPNPAELLLDEKIESIFNYCKQHFDFIIVDTAPMGLVSDALVLSKYANCCLYIIRQRYTYLKQLEFIDELYRSKKLRQLALIVNDVKSGVGGYAYGGYGYGYGYSHGYGYGGYHEEEEISFWARIRDKFSRKAKQK